MDTPARVAPTAIPILTLAVCAAAAAVFAVPALQDLLIYDRAAIAGGEIWRLVTGHLVHHSLSHLAYDVIAFLIAGLFVEPRHRSRFASLCLTAAIAIGGVLYVAAPSMVRYGGLSGLVTAVMVYLCLYGMSDGGRRRLLGLIGLALIAAKLGIELWSGAFIFVSDDPSRFTPVPLSHVIGALAAIAVFRWPVRPVWATLMKSFSRRPRRRSAAHSPGGVRTVRW